MCNSIARIQSILEREPVRGQYIRVEYRDVEYLIREVEKLEAQFVALDADEHSRNLHEIVHKSLTALFYNLEESTSRTMLAVMHTLTPLIETQVQREMVSKMRNHHDFN